MKSMVDHEEIGNCLNHEFVAERFNRFDFRPESVPEFDAFLTLEEKRQAIFSSSNYQLGAMYGTLTQNFGFCGPACLQSLLKTADRAEDAFGRKYRREKQRLTNYRIYGFLDNGSTEQATSLVNGYLNLTPLAGPDDWFAEIKKNLLTSGDIDSTFKAALILRVLADTGYRPNAIISPEYSTVVLKQTAHPWQFISLNLGRILLSAEKPDPAEDLFRHSLRICSAGGDTMRPMGLLALAELHAAGLVDKQDYRNTLEITRWLADEAPLHTNHFRIILAPTTADILLETVMKNRSVLFPFSYR
jgi:hypothetical protein